MDIAYIPSPSTGVIHLGPIPLRGYAFCIIIGVFVAVWLGNKRWIARGGKPGTVADIAVWAVPFGLVGGRLYHVITDYQLYFGEGRNWVDAFKIWEGGLGIWGAIALGAVGAWIGCRLRGIPLPAWADALAPGIALAQACGRWGNWFNQELYGRATDLPWAVEISAGPNRDAGTYHPTFLYESLWCVGVAFLVIWADRRFKLGHGRAFALYVAAYCVGRGWIEYMRVDEAHHILGVRLNVWTSIVVFVLAVVYFVLSAKLRPGREEVVEPDVPGGEGKDKTEAKDKAKDKAEAKAEDTTDGTAQSRSDAAPKDSLPTRAPRADAAVREGAVKADLRKPAVDAEAPEADKA
ncbi:MULTISPECIES: prolipoprotein diacylglyceryl transferase [Streptomyces]|uniref:Phosphatidylglycerol--prolipoprotein diacylglyceryl transferase n=1 Tax=Streptomyces virginiae TaxID=1961 RepID=A0ABQ3NYY4_STRVG|nr:MULTISPECIES: prolipoprotein diacylglyceryl transferase [Streptomyces]MBP2343591.1 prolipoprotein diacylglyceryl transferase [Streptomyces virginiae]MCI4080993.1 prolipoprotein diacylglyceryl transferase [Streptomyces sp. MMS21 TC-5]GGQ37127.1 prolipoprotein diacylglyceryl transferase 1 [Streptomyces virginiae]GHI17978.1 prolipoprotein diacylglyceryl transferase 1 [Streptomyces virginiae]